MAATTIPSHLSSNEPQHQQQEQTDKRTKEEVLEKLDRYMSTFARLQGLDRMDEETMLQAVEAFHQQAIRELDIQDPDYFARDMLLA